LNINHQLVFKIYGTSVMELRIHFPIMNQRLKFGTIFDAIFEMI
jgi:hypothetical protein